MKNIYTRLLNELKINKPIALATIINTRGSTPQITGASALFHTGGLLTGTLGGGLLEADAQKRALNSLQSNLSFLYKFNLTADISSEEGAICGGEATILIDVNPQEHLEMLESISESFGKREPGVIATFISKFSEKKIDITRQWIKTIKDAADNPTIAYCRFQKEIKKSFTENKPILLKVEENPQFEAAEETLLFLEPVYPLPHLIIAGAGHIGQALSHLGSLLDFEVTIIDDRPEFANKEKLPKADHIIVDDISKVMKTISIFSDKYIVIVTRGHRNDADVLRQCIDSDAVYIGMIGSARKIDLMRKKFLQEGWATQAQWNRVYAPIGIDIQSKTVQEIAVSIAAQLILIRRQKRHDLRSAV